jgi:protein-S-isoprenylcysteine O-methyltransferase Ste14
MTRNSSPETSRGWGYLAVQAALFALLAFGPRNLQGMTGWSNTFAFIASMAGTVLFVSGLILATTGVIHLGKNLTPLPVPKNSATLVVTGAYRLVRHPIYCGLIFMAFSWGLWVNSWLTIGYALLLFIFFDIKSRFEECLLEKKFPEYAAYRSRVKKLLPYIY